MEPQESGRFQDDRGTGQPARAHEERTHAGDDAISAAEIGCTFPGTIQDQQLLLDEERIKPGHPQQNGRHERMHLTLKREATKPASANVLQQQARFDDSSRATTPTGRTGRSG
jgi:hypothetical protein